LEIPGFRALVEQGIAPDLVATNNPAGEQAEEYKGHPERTAPAGALASAPTAQHEASMVVASGDLVLQQLNMGRARQLHRAI